MPARNKPAEMHFLPVVEPSGARGRESGEAREFEERPGRDAGMDGPS